MWPCYFLCLCQHWAMACFQLDQLLPVPCSSLLFYRSDIVSFQLISFLHVWVKTKDHVCNELNSHWGVHGYQLLLIMPAMIKQSEPTFLLLLQTWSNSRASTASVQRLQLQASVQGASMKVNWIFGEIMKFYFVMFLLYPIKLTRYQNVNPSALDRWKINPLASTNSNGICHLKWRN